MDEPDHPDELGYLLDATRRIGTGLDADRAVGALCEALVPRLGDTAAVYGPADGGALHRLAHNVLPGVPEPPAILTALPVPAAEALRTGRPRSGPLCEGDPSELLAVPLRFADGSCGFTAVMRAPGRPAFDERDVLAAALLTEQAVLTLQHSSLYRREADIAAALQSSMLPKSPPALHGVEIAHRYLPSETAAQVGGDWFDAVPLSGSRVALIIGDVMGHGIPSAATMGQLRTAARTLASLDLPPEQALRHLDEIARQLGDDHLATCLFSVYDPVSRRCTMATAGHIPPVLVDPGGDTRVLDIPPGTPLGLGMAAYEAVEVPAPDGALLALCTDGLVESRRQDLDAGLAALAGELTAPDRPLDQLCDDVLKTLHSEQREDDVALLLARFRGIPSGNVAQWMMRAHPLTAARVRQLVRRTLADWDLRDCSDVVELLVTELVSNAIRFASRPIGIRLLRTDTLLCEVTDDDHRLPEMREPDVFDESGRGLTLIGHLAGRWGASRTTTGKVVWFEVNPPRT